VNFWANALRAGDSACKFFSGPVEAEGGTGLLPRWAGTSGISWQILSLVKKTLHRNCAGFEPQRASPIIKRAKVPSNTRRSLLSPKGDPSLCAILDTIGGVGALYQWRSKICQIVKLSRPPPRQDLGRARTADSRFARNDKELGPQLEVAITRRTAS
jgi:hypothetical protein